MRILGTAVAVSTLAILGACDETMTGSTGTSSSVAVAQGGLPQLNATCPGGNSVHADQGGPVFINGTEAELTKFSDSYYEAKGSGITASISSNPDGTASVSYTGSGGANGVCSVS